jgi:hypothetical protein
MKIFFAGLAATILLGSADLASAQVRPQWTYDGSAVCPEGHDYRRGACWARGYGRYREGYGGGSQVVRPRWTRSGSAVCPDGFDYAGGACRSRY